MNSRIKRTSTMPSGAISDSHVCFAIISIRPVQSTARVSRPETQCVKNGAEASVLDNLQLTVRGAPNLRRQPPPLHPVGTHPHGAVVRYHITTFTKDMSLNQHLLHTPSPYCFQSYYAKIHIAIIQISELLGSKQSVKY